MDRREKQRKFHQAIIDTLYPPPPQHHHQEDSPIITAPAFDVTLIKDPEEYDSPSSSRDDEDGDGDGEGCHKLTRAQRKRLRKKKLKECSSSAPQRRKIIGPLLDCVGNNPDGDDGSVGEGCSQRVRRNASENLSQDTPSDSEDCNAQKEGKLKRRRMAKKLARENRRPSKQQLDECDKDRDSANE